MVRRLNGSFKPNAFEFVPSPIKFISTSFIPRFFSYPIPFRAFPRGWTQRPRGLDHFNRPDVSRPTHLNHLFLSLTPMSNTARPSDVPAHNCIICIAIQCPNHDSHISQSYPSCLNLPNAFPTRIPFSSSPFPIPLSPSHSVSGGMYHLSVNPLPRCFSNLNSNL
jgi:hypothetical protein